MLEELSRSALLWMAAMHMVRMFRPERIPTQNSLQQLGEAEHKSESTSWLVVSVTCLPAQMLTCGVELPC
jgi:hypothetical protein